MRWLTPEELDARLVPTNLGHQLFPLDNPWNQRFRLKANFAIPATWSPEAQAIAQVMKTYGLIVADNGSDMYVTGTPSDQWIMDVVFNVQAIPATQFEVVDLTPAVTGLGATSRPIRTVVPGAGRRAYICSTFPDRRGHAGGRTGDQDG